MRNIALLTPCCILALASPALAFDFGFLKAPDWMDKWLILLIVVLIPFSIIAMRHKPRGVSLLAMDKSALSPFAKLSVYISMALVSIITTMLLVGMGLARM